MTYQYSHGATDSAYIFQVLLDADYLNGEAFERNYGPDAAICASDCLTVTGVSQVFFACQSKTSGESCSIDNIQFFGTTVRRKLESTILESSAELASDNYVMKLPAISETPNAESRETDDLGPSIIPETAKFKSQENDALEETSITKRNELASGNDPTPIPEMPIFDLSTDYPLSQAAADFTCSAENVGKECPDASDNFNCCSSGGLIEEKYECGTCSSCDGRGQLLNGRDNMGRSW